MRDALKEPMFDALRDKAIFTGLRIDEELSEMSRVCRSSLSGGDIFHTSEIDCR
jgi:hypothetical protein